MRPILVDFDFKLCVCSFGFGEGFFDSVGSSEDDSYAAVAGDFRFAEDADLDTRFSEHLLQVAELIFFCISLNHNRFLS